MANTTNAMATPMTSDGPIIFICTKASPDNSACQPERHIALATSVICFLDVSVTSLAGVLYVTSIYAIVLSALSEWFSYGPTTDFTCVSFAISFKDF
ncbi:hypothetical protein D3C71_1675270 [compost metagenome]